MTPDQANALIQHLAKQYLADLIPAEAFEALSPKTSSNADMVSINDWDHKVALLHHWEQVLNPAQTEEDLHPFLEIIKQALWQQRKVWMAYDGKTKKFQFNCFGLVQRDQQFFLVGSYWEHQEPYLLSVRKIIELNLSDEPSVPAASDFNLQDYASLHLNHTQELELDVLEIEFPAHLLSYVKAYPLSSANNFEIIEQGDYFTLKATHVADSLRFRQWLSGFNDEARIIAPDALRKVINLSCIDDLTNLYNRRYFDRLFQREIQKFCRDPDYRFTLLSIDIDHFKKINDNYGHAMGDGVLKKVSACFKKLRGQDAIRFGGEEFIILLTESTNLDAALVAAERIRQAVSEIELYEEITQERIPLTISIGIAEFPTHLPKSFRPANTQTKLDAKTIQEFMDAMLQQADAALYRAKHLGRDRCESANGLNSPSEDTQNGFF